MASQLYFIGKPVTSAKLIISPAAFSGAVNNWDPVDADDATKTWDAADIVRVNVPSTLSAVITGFAAPTVPARALKLLVNTTTTGWFSIPTLDGGSSSANQVLTPAEASFRLHSYSAVWIWYDFVVSKWRVLDSRASYTIKSSVTIDFGTLSADSTTHFDAPFSSFGSRQAYVNDVVSVSPRSDLPNRTGIVSARISSLNNVRVTLMNFHTDSVVVGEVTLDVTTTR